jgi:hypothetical protein
MKMKMKLNENENEALMSTANGEHREWCAPRMVSTANGEPSRFYNVELKASSILSFVIICLIPSTLDGHYERLKKRR